MITTTQNFIKLFFVFLTLLLVYWLLQTIANKYVQDLITNKVPATMTIHYSDITTNILLGNVNLNTTTLKIKGKEDSQYHTLLTSDNIEIKGIGYWDLLFNNQISIRKISVNKPNLSHYPSRKTEANKTVTSQKGAIEILNIKEIQVANGALNIMKKNSENPKIALPDFNLKINGGKIDLESSDQNFISFDSYEFTANTITLDTNEYERIQIGSLNADEKMLAIKKFQIKSKFNKTALSKHLSKERDYINLEIPQIDIKKLDFNFTNKQLYFTVPMITVHKPNLEMYRDKLLPDDKTTNLLYSKSLRELSFGLQVDSIKIKEGSISYAELVDPTKEAGKIFFTNVNANVYQLSNHSKGKRTEIKISSKLMGRAPLNLNWSFDVNNKADVFSVSGSVNNLDAKALNPFFKPNLNALAEGTLQEMNFNFTGNKINSKGEIKMKYDDFNFKILRKNTSEVNKIVTAIGNLFIKEDSKSNSKDFRYGVIEAERDATKSFFNYLWISLKSGMINTLTSDGEK